MRVARTRAAVVAALAALGALVAASGARYREPAPVPARIAAAQPVADPPRLQAVGGQRGTEAEPSIAVDPRDGRRVVAVFQVGRFADGGAAAIGVARSADGGETWRARLLPRLSRATGGAFDRASDPTVAIGPDGAVYVATIAFDVPHRACKPVARSAVAVQRSADGGTSFGPPVLVRDDRVRRCSTPVDDKPAIAVDADPLSPDRGRVTIAWSLGERLAVSTSDDGGLSWSPAARPPGARPATGALPLPLVGGGMTVIYDHPRHGPTAAVAAVSTRVPGLWERPRRIAAVRAAPVPGVRAGPREGFPTAAADPIDGTLYVAWPGAVRRAADGAFPLSDIFISRSTGGGRTWSAPRAALTTPAGGSTAGPGGEGPRLTRPPDGPTARPERARGDVVAATPQVRRYLPSVAAYAGRVALAFVEQPDGSMTAAEHVSTSVDGAAMFVPPMAVGPPIDLRAAARTCVACGTRVARSAAFLGDYLGLAAGPDAAHLAWEVAGGPGAPRQQTWSAAVSG